MLEREVLVPIGVGVETGRKSSVGAGLIVVGIDFSKNGENAVNPLIYSLVELKSNPDTEKRAGQTSIPLERKKTNETPNDNILGALAEVIDDRNLAYFGQHLYQVSGSFHEGKGFLKGKPVDLAILIYDGILGIRFNPLSSSEVNPKGWVSLEEFQKTENVRPLARQLVDVAVKDHLIKTVVNSWEHFPERKKLFIPNGFRIELSERERAKKRDIVSTPDL